MANTYTQLIVHAVFSTKFRAPVIPAHAEKDLYAYIGGTIRSMGGKSITANGIEDHAHVLFYMPPKISVSDFVGKIKSGSSQWLADLKPRNQFEGWQGGFSAFSVDWSRIDGLRKYIDNQKIHHQTQSGEEELRELLEKASVEYDEKYLWK